MRKRIPIIAAGLLVLAVSAVAVGCNHRHRRVTPERAHKFTSRVIDHGLDEIDATDEQARQIQGVRKVVVDDFLAQRPAHDAAKAAVLAELAKDQPDAAALHKLIDERAAEMTKLAHRTADHILQVHATLTPAQRKQLLDEYRARTPRR